MARTAKFFAGVSLDAEHHTLVVTDVAELPRVLADARHELQNGSIEPA